MCSAYWETVIHKCPITFFCVWPNVDNKIFRASLSNLSAVSNKLCGPTLALAWLLYHLGKHLNLCVCVCVVVLLGFFSLQLVSHISAPADLLPLHTAMESLKILVAFALSLGAALAATVSMQTYRHVWVREFSPVTLVSSDSPKKRKLGLAGDY